MTVALTLKKDGDKLSGTIAGPQGDVAVEGTQKDNAVAVNFTVQTPNGAFAIVMNGKQDGDAIAGTMDFGGQGQAEWTGKRRGGAASRRRARPRRQGRPRSPPTSRAPGRCKSTSAAMSSLPAVTLKQDGEKLTGTYSSQMLGEQPLTGTIKGNDITFGFQASFDGNAVKVTYTGKVDKDTMKGSVAFGDLGEGTFTGKKK